MQDVAVAELETGTPAPYTSGRDSRSQAELNWSVGLWEEDGGTSLVRLVRAIKAY